jgi:predicted signal transduction protein with EAL and GGDEF domain
MELARTASVDARSGLKWWPIGPAEEPLGGFVRAEQLSAVSRLTPIAMGGNLVSAAVIVWTFRNTSGGPFALAWAAVMLGLCGHVLWRWSGQRRRPKRSRASARAIRRLTIHGCLIASLWSLAPLVLFPHADGNQQVLVASLVAGLICGGGFSLAAVPSAALAYVIIMVVAANVALAASGEPLFILVGLLLLVYSAMLGASVLWHARLFVARHTDQHEVRRQSEVIGLLLKDFEEHSSDWLWETDREGRLQHVSLRLAEALGGTWMACAERGSSTFWRAHPLPGRALPPSPNSQTS